MQYWEQERPFGQGGWVWPGFQLCHWGGGQICWFKMIIGKPRWCEHFGFSPHFNWPPIWGNESVRVSSLKLRFWWNCETFGEVKIIVTNSKGFRFWRRQRGAETTLIKHFLPWYVLGIYLMCTCYGGTWYGGTWYVLGMVVHGMYLVSTWYVLAMVLKLLDTSTPYFNSQLF